jgi:hypothetical protein
MHMLVIPISSYLILISINFANVNLTMITNQQLSFDIEYFFTKISIVINLFIFLNLNFNINYVVNHMKIVKFIVIHNYYDDFF